MVTGLEKKREMVSWARVVVWSWSEVGKFGCGVYRVTHRLSVGQDGKAGSNDNSNALT